MEWNELFDNVPVIDIEEKKMEQEYNRFKKLVSEESEEDKDDAKKTEEAKDAFIGAANDIAAIRNRPFRIEERNKIKEADNWEEITTYLKNMVKFDSNSPKDGLSEVYEELENFMYDKIKEESDSKPLAATLRLAASVLPNYLTSIASPSDIQELLKFLKKEKLVTKDEYKDINKKSSFKKSNFLLQKIREEYNKYPKHKESCYSLPWKLLEFFRGKDFIEIEANLRYNQNIILTGAPGTGKTYLAKKVASYMITGNSDFERFEKEVDTFLEDEEDKNFVNDKENFKTRCKFVQFHPSYDYTDFVEGLRPKQDDKSRQIVFERRDGIFKKFCKDAVNEVSKAKEEKREPDPFVFIIDEINRGEISKIFGELFFSIDPGYRGEKGKVDTQYQNLIEQSTIKDNKRQQAEQAEGTNNAETNNSNKINPEADLFAEGFYVPQNVYVIGTMNDIDRSVESMDFAFRRRFAFYEVKAMTSSSMLNFMKEVPTEIIDKLKNRMTNLNNKIVSEEKYGLSSAYQIGGAYFKKFENYYGKTKDVPFETLWDNHLKGLLYEYFRGLPKKEIDGYIKELKVVYDDESKHEAK